MREGRTRVPSDLPEAFRRASWRYADRIAVEDLAGRSLTFAEVEDRSNRLSNALQAVATRGDRVGVIVNNVLEMVEIDIALIKAGLVKVPLNLRLTSDERDYVLKDCDVRIILAAESERAYVSDAAAELDLARPPIVLGDSYDEVLRLGSDRPAYSRRYQDDLSQVLYTSGTTGRPKGAMLSEGLRIDAARRMLVDELRDIGSGDSMGHVAQMSHGSGSKVLAYYLRGAKNVPIERFDPEQLLMLADLGRVTCSFMVPTMIGMMVEAQKARNDAAPALNTVTYGGAVMEPSTMAEAIHLFGSVFVQVYGSCEAPHPILVMNKAEHQQHLRRTDGVAESTAGRESMFTAVGILDTEGEQVPDGEVGELCIPAEQAMLGYWQAPDETANVLHGGWYWTGDLASRDPQGRIQLVGRLRDMIISGGYNVYAAEVERVVKAHAKVREAAVAGLPDKKWGEIVAAWVVPQDGAIDADELTDFCRASLAGYKIPRRIEIVAELPKGTTGKVLHAELKRSVTQ